MDRHFMIKLLEKELNVQRRFLASLETRWNVLPEGALWLRETGGGRLYYREFRDGGEKMRIAIPGRMPSGRRLISQLLERRVIYHARPKLRKSIKALEQAVANLYMLDPQTRAEGERLPDHLFLPDQLNAQKWLEDTEAVNYRTNPGYSEGLQHITSQGQTVRSKSEVLISDALREAGLPFRYECELVLSNGEVIYPDFTVYLPEENRLIYIEHFGRMDDPAYALKNLRRLEKYADSGFILGYDLFYTVETKRLPLTNQQICELLRRITRSRDFALR